MTKLILKIEEKNDKNNITSKRLRRNGIIPVNILDFGKSITGVMKLKDFEDILQNNIRKSTTISLSTEKNGDFPVFIKEIQRLPHNNQVIHVDFYKPQSDKMFISEVGIEVVGSPKGVKKGGQFSHLIHQLKVKTFLKDAQEKIVVDVSDLDVGESIKVSQLKLNSSWQILLNQESIVVSVNKTKALLAKERQEKVSA